MASTVGLNLNNKRWFHPNIDGIQAEKMLKEPDVPVGTFLVRPSTTPGNFTLSVRRDGEKVTHVRITKNADDCCYDLHGGEAFASLSELVQFYLENPQLRGTNGETIELKYPLYATDPTPERWFHTGIDGAQAEQLLKEQGQNGSFLVRESQSVSGSFVISLRTHDGPTPVVTHVIIYCRNKKYDIGGGDEFDSLSDLIEHYRKNAMVETSGTVMHLKTPLNSTRIWAPDLKKKIECRDKVVAGVKQRTGFRDEFEAIVQQNDSKHWYSCREGQKAENRAKNRFKNILPYDHTRIILKDENGFTLSHSDYINANMIQVMPEYEEFAGVQRTYISTQGCLPTTVDDFWRMVWQENCPVIVMITKEVEKNKPKCVRYWPELEKTKIHGLKGELSLTNLEEQTKMDFMRRKFLLKKSSDPSERFVYHFQFTAWPDHGVPSDPATVLNFLEEVNACMERNYPTSTGPVLVHCSAGCGRSGAFVAIDLILCMLKKNGLNSYIDISRTVQMIRTQRSAMVQTDAQYRFVYAAVQEYVDAVLKHLAEHKKLELTGREYSNIRYTAESNAPTNGQRTPTTPSAVAGLADPSAAENASAFCVETSEIKPLKLDLPPLSKKITTLN